MKIQEIELKEECSDPFEETKALFDQQAEAIFIIGLEHSIHNVRTVASLNASRELWQELEKPVLFWLPEFGAEIVINQARDIWAWNSHVFQFDTKTISSELRFDGVAGITGMGGDDVYFRIAELEQHLRSIANSKAFQLKNEYLLRLEELMLLYARLLELAKVEELGSEALHMSQSLRLRDHECRILLLLAGNKRSMGLIEDAERLARNALAIAETQALNTPQAMALLAAILSDLGKFDEALNVVSNAASGKGVTQEQQMPVPLRVAMADLHSKSGHFAEALDEARGLLEVADKTNDVGLRLAMLNLLGNLNIRKGDLTQGAKYYESLMEQHAELGLVKREIAYLNKLVELYTELDDETKLIRTRERLDRASGLL
ncbi:MAG TPA: hypothetical protein VGL56_17305 [Fimbriimonadaceae bacterium]